MEFFKLLAFKFICWLNLLIFLINQLKLKILQFEINILFKIILLKIFYVKFPFYIIN